MIGRAVLNAFLLAALVATVASNWVVTPNPSQPNVEFLPQMAHSPRYNAFAANPDFADGSTLRRPQPGSIARGYLPLHYDATPAEALRAGEELRRPVETDSERARERGAFVFANFCQVCHGAGGAGNGTVVQRGFPAPPSLLAEHALKMKDGQMFHVLTYGQNNMPSYASQLSRDDRWNVIAYLRSLQAAAPAAKPQAAGSTAVPPPPGVQP